MPTQTFNLAINDPVERIGRSRPLPAKDDNALHMLLIEDDAGDVLLAYEMLKEGMADYAWTVQTVHNMEDAVQELMSDTYDIALVDLTLDDAVGAGIVDLISMVAPQVPIVAYTGSSNEQLLGDTLRRGAKDCILKNGLTPELMRASVLRALAKA